MTDIFQAAAEVQAFCVKQRWKFCFIGGVALQKWGEPRVTLDVDLTILTNFYKEDAYIDKLLTKFESRIPNAKSFAAANRILLLKTDDGIAVDLSLAGMPFEERVCKRAKSCVFPKVGRLRICTAEDLVVLKAFADRGRDWHDIDGILARSGPSLDWARIVRELSLLSELKDSPEIMVKLSRLRESHDLD